MTVAVLCSLLVAMEVEVEVAVWKGETSVTAGDEACEEALTEAGVAAVVAEVLTLASEETVLVVAVFVLIL